LLGIFHSVGGNVTSPQNIVKNGIIRGPRGLFPLQLRVADVRLFDVVRDLYGRPVRHPAGLFRVRPVPEDVAAEQLERRQGAHVRDDRRHGGRLLRDVQAVRGAVFRVQANPQCAGKRECHDFA